MTSQRFSRDMFEDFDIDDKEFNDNFTDVLDEFVDKCPVAKSNVGNGYYLINRYQDVRKCGQDWQTFSSAEGFQPNRQEGSPYLYPEECDPPYHDNWRKALNPYFGPRAVAKFEDQIRADAKDLVDGFIDKGSCEFISEFASELPGRAFFKNLIDVPIEDLPMLLEAMDGGIYGPLEDRAACFGKAFGYLGEHLAKFQDADEDSLCAAIARGVDRDGEVCPWEDRVSILTDLTLGGIATTTYVMSGAMHHLATHPADQRALAEDPALMVNAVEEFARMFPPVVALGRSVTKDVEVSGHQFKEGDFVLLNYASASRDPEAVDNPTKVDIHREAVVHTSFGVGVHRCIGAHLARLELRVVLEELLGRLPEFHVKEGSEPTHETGVLRSMTKLELEFPGGGRK